MAPAAASALAGSAGELQMNLNNQKITPLVHPNRFNGGIMANCQKKMQQFFHVKRHPSVHFRKGPVADTITIHWPPELSFQTLNISLVRKNMVMAIPPHLLCHCTC
jgi:hypothetical protein